MKRWMTYGIVAALLVVGLLGWWRFFDLRSAAGDNLALADEAKTAEVEAEVTQALEQVLSFDHANPQPTQDAAAALLDGDAREEYDKLFADLEAKAPGQQLVLTASVAASGVVELEDDEATLLVFVDQSSRKADDEDASVSAAQLKVEAEQTSDGWKITDLEPL